MYILKKIANFVFIFLIAILLGCSPIQDDYTSLDNTDVSHQKPLRVFVPVYGREELFNLYDQASRIFTEKYGIEVELYPEPLPAGGYNEARREVYQDNPAGDAVLMYKEKLRAEILSGNGPDVVISSTDTIGYLFGDLFKMIESGVLYEVYPVLRTS